MIQFEKNNRSSNRSMTYTCIRKTQSLDARIDKNEKSSTKDINPFELLFVFLHLHLLTLKVEQSKLNNKQHSSVRCYDINPIVIAVSTKHKNCKTKARTSIEYGNQSEEFAQGRHTAL